MVMPMPDFTRYGKTAPCHCATVHGDDRPALTTDDRRFRRIEWAILYDSPMSCGRKRKIYPDSNARGTIPIL
jgi:hypothetical protein